MDIIVDSNLTEAEALADHPERPAPMEIRSQLCLLTLKYWSYDGAVHQGQLVVNELIANRVEAAFARMFNEHIPITKMVPVCVYNWDDERSMQDNTTSGYNFRTIAGTETLSLHAQGLAIDIDPLFNPLIKGEVVIPTGASYDPARNGTLTSDSPTVQIFKSLGFCWGGDWLAERGYVDYQHFDMPSLARPSLTLHT